MKLTRAADYTVRLLMYLAMIDRKVSAFEVAAMAGLPQNLMTALIRPLRSGGLVKTAKGVHGGIWLAKPADEITLAQVLSIAEGDDCIMSCLETPSDCNSRNFRPERCQIRKHMGALDGIIRGYCESVTIGELAREDAPESYASQTGREDTSPCS